MENDGAGFGLDDFSTLLCLRYIAAGVAVRDPHGGSVP
jgi:hypothetical protein